MLIIHDVASLNFVRTSVGTSSASILTVFEGLIGRQRESHTDGRQRTLTTRLLRSTMNEKQWQPSLFPTVLLLTRPRDSFIYFPFVTTSITVADSDANF